MPGVSAVVIVRDEQKMLAGCLRRLDFVNDVVVVVDDRTKDDSVKIAGEFGARVIVGAFDGFARLKNLGLQAVSEDWTLVIDADERVGPSLAAEIRSVLVQGARAFDVERVNYFLGRRIRHGGWPERQIRLFRSGSALYVGALHERLSFHETHPQIGQLKSPLHHFTHRSVIDDLYKTANFAEVWAHDHKQAGDRQVSARWLTWVLVREIVYRLGYKQGWRDGVPGLIECLHWSFSSMLYRARLWELQQSPPIEELYEQIEEQLP